MKSQSFKVSVNGQFSFNDINLDQLNAIELEEGVYHIIKGNKNFQAEVLKASSAEKNYQIRINGTVYEVSIADEMDLLVKELGLSAISTKKVKDIKAPMPGLVLDILIEPGSEVKEGDQLLILEAMKMENVIKSPGEGIVKSIKVEKGEAVEKGFVLVEME